MEFDKVAGRDDLVKVHLAPNHNPPLVVSKVVVALACTVGLPSHKLSSGDLIAKSRQVQSSGVIPLSSSSIFSHSRRPVST
jgi:hypothetical protein